MRRKSTVLLVAGAAAVAAAPALAHTQISSKSPSTSASTKTGSVTATFTQQIRSGRIAVYGPGKGSRKKVSNGNGARDPRKVSRIRTELRKGLKKGTYTAKWSIKAIDGHEQSGSWTFKLR